MNPTFSPTCTRLIALGALLLLPACGGEPSKGGKPGGSNSSSSGGGRWGGMGRGGSGRGAPKALPLVKVAPVVTRMVQREIRTTGYLEAEYRILVEPQISGQIAGLVLFQQGAPVKAGDVLCRLDDREARALAKQLQVQREAAEVQLDLAELEVQTAKRRTSQRRIERDQTKNEYDRQKSTDPTVVIPRELDDAKFAFEGAEEALQVALFDVRKAELEVARAKNSIDELDSRIEENTITLEKHTILAPIDGIIEERLVTGGETVGPGTQLFTVVDPSRLIARLARPQQELAAVRGAEEVAFTTDSDPDHIYIADVEVVGPVINQETGQFDIRIRVRPEDTEQLLPGMFIRSKILTEAERPALVVPKEAVLTEGQLSVVFAIRENQAVRLDLDQGLTVGDFIECRNVGDSGLQASDEVAVVGHEDLRDQSQVRVLREDGAIESPPGVSDEGSASGGAPTDRSGEPSGEAPDPGAEPATPKPNKAEPKANKAESKAEGDTTPTINKSVDAGEAASMLREAAVLSRSRRRMRALGPLPLDGYEPPAPMESVGWLGTRGVGFADADTQPEMSGIVTQAEGNLATVKVTEMPEGAELKPGYRFAIHDDGKHTATLVVTDVANEYAIGRVTGPDDATDPQVAVGCRASTPKHQAGG